MMLRTPFGTISVLIDNIEIQYVCVKLPVGGYSYREVTARYAIPVFWSRMEKNIRLIADSSIYRVVFMENLILEKQLSA